MRLYHLLLCCVVLVSAACHADRPIIDPSPKPSVGGTIAGIVTTANPPVAVPGRKVTATEINKGSHYETTTAANGGTSRIVPAGVFPKQLRLRGNDTGAPKKSQQLAR